MKINQRNEHFFLSQGHFTTGINQGTKMRPIKVIRGLLMALEPESSAKTFSANEFNISLVSLIIKPIIEV